MKARFEINYIMQKSAVTGRTFKDFLTYEVLSDICMNVTQQKDYEVIWIDKPYNKGRLIKLYHDDMISYISLSENIVESRNSVVQSVPSALNLYYSEERPNKDIYFYFLDHEGNLATDYHVFIYRLLVTVGVKLLRTDRLYRDNPHLIAITPFKNIDELIGFRMQNKNRNSSNNSSYVSMKNKLVEMYAKTYGASKYESTLMAVAVSRLLKKSYRFNLYNVCEGDLKQLPKSSLETLRALGNVNIINTSLVFEKQSFMEHPDLDHLRSKLYYLNLFKKFHHKHCALCGCEIEEIVQGAHIWGVSEIKKSRLSLSDKFDNANDGDNGLWLCENHHKLFDSNIIALNPEGKLLVDKSLSTKNRDFIEEITTQYSLDDSTMTSGTCNFINQRNMYLDLSNFEVI